MSSARLLARIYNSSRENPLTERERQLAQKVLSEKTDKILAENNLVVANF